jgi:hypothetical protein
MSAQFGVVALRLSFNGAPPLWTLVTRAGEGVITPSQIRYVGYYNEILQGTSSFLFELLLPSLSLLLGFAGSGSGTTR